MDDLHRDRRCPCANGGESPAKLTTFEQHARVSLSRLRNALAFFVTATATLTVLGCSNIPSLDAEVLPPEKNEPLAEPAVNYTVGVLPIHVDTAFDGRREAINEGGASEDHRRVMPLDPETRRGVIQETVEALATIQAVDEIRMLDGVSPGELDEAMEAAWDQGLDLVVRPVLRRHDAYHAGTTGSYVPMLVVWMALSPVPTWWWAYERFGADVALHWEVYGTAQRHRDPVIAEELLASLDYRFHDFDQGFNLFNPFRTPGGMSERQWERVGSRLLPLARREAQREFVRYVRDTEAGFAAALEQHEEKLHKSLALLIGRDAHDPRGRQQAEPDVVRVRDALLTRGAAGTSWMQPWMIELLDGPRVTQESVRLALEEHFSQRMRPGDHGLLVLAMHGTWDAQGEPWLVLGDTPEQRISVAALTETLASLPGHVAVVAAVNWVDSPQAAVTPEEAEWPWDAVSSLPNVALLTATAGPWQPVLEVEQLPGSVFMAELARVLREAAGESELSLAEIAESLTPEIQRLARREGTVQSPVLIGDEQLTSAAFFRAAPERISPAEEEQSEEDSTQETAAWPAQAE